MTDIPDIPLNEEDKKNEPTEKPRNIIQGDITKDSFFDDSLDDVDLDGLGGVNLPRIGDTTKEDIAEVLKEDIELSPKPKKQTLPTQELSSGTSLADIKIEKSETKMAANGDSNKEKIDAMWDAFAEENDSDYKLMVHRQGPQTLKGVKIAGYLETFYVPITIPDIIEATGNKYGGGAYVIKVVDSAGRYVKSKQFSIAGLPKIPDDVSEAPKPEPEKKTPTASTSDILKALKSSDDDDEDEDEDEDDTPKKTVRTRSRFRRRSVNPFDDDDDDDEEDTSPRFQRRPPMRPGLGGLGGGMGMGGNPFGTPTFGSSGGRSSVSPNDLNKMKETLEEKIESKLDNKFELISSKLNTFAAQMNRPQSGGMLSPELLQAALPLIGTFLESKGAKDNVMASQFSEVNNQMASLFQTLQESQRMNERARDEMLEKERREREQARKEWLEQNARAEERAREAARQQEERFQSMMSKMTESLERRFNDEMTQQQKMMMEQQRLQEEARRREEEARAESRRREEEFRAKMEQEERQFRAMMQQKEEENRIKYEEMQARLRQSEMQAEREARQKELEIIERMKNAEIEKFQLQNDQMQKRMNDHLGTKDYELKMQLAIQEMKSQNDQDMQELKAKLALEELNNKQQLQLTKLKYEMDDKKKDGDPFDKIMEDYMRKRVMIMMARELEGVEMADDDDTPSSMKDLMGTVIKTGAESLGPLVEAMLKGGVGGGRSPMPGRVVAPSAARNPSPPPAPAPAQNPPNAAAGEQQQAPQPQPQPQAEDDLEDDEYEEYEDDSAGGFGFDIGDIDLNNLSVNMFNPAMLAEIEKITSFFDYLKGSIEANGDPKEAAQVAKENLLPEIVDYISSVEDSRIVIQDLEMLLDGTDPELKPFFYQPPSVEWLNTMLTHLRELQSAGAQTQQEQTQPQQ